jgi:hypothetical protein
VNRPVRALPCRSPFTVRRSPFTVRRSAFAGWRRTAKLELQIKARGNYTRKLAHACLRQTLPRVIRINERNEDAVSILRVSKTIERCGRPTRLHSMLLVQAERAISSLAENFRWHPFHVQNEKARTVRPLLFFDPNFGQFIQAELTRLLNRSKPEPSRIRKWLEISASALTFSVCARVPSMYPAKRRRSARVSCA